MALKRTGRILIFPRNYLNQRFGRFKGFLARPVLQFPSFGIAEGVTCASDITDQIHCIERIQAEFRQTKSACGWKL
jgi:hypothetical protein